MPQVTESKWFIRQYNGEYELPQLLLEIRVEAWGLPLIGDYQGCVVAYIPGDYNKDNDESRELAIEIASFITSLKEENERLKAEAAKWRRRNERNVDYIAYLEGRDASQFPRGEGGR